jgi:hypothetical protein
MPSFKRSDGHFAEVPPIPPGIYTIKAESCVEQNAKNSDSTYLNTKFVIVEGPQARSAFWMRFTTYHPTSKIAEDIGREQLTQWEMACGKSTGNTDDLIGIPFKARIGIEKNSDSRRITAFFRSNGNRIQPPEREAEPAGYTDQAVEKREAEAKRKAAEKKDEPPPKKDEPPPRDIDDDIPDI